MCHGVQIPHSKDDDSTRRVFVSVSKLPELKSDHYFKNKERAIIEFLMLEGFAGEEIVIRLRNVYGSAALQYSDGSAKFAGAKKNSKAKDAPTDSIDTKRMRRFCQPSKRTRMPG
jgi:hypothetical protein